LPYMLDMLLPGTTIYKDIIKENQHKLSKIRPKEFIHQSLKVAGALVSPNGIIKYSRCPECVLNAVLYTLASFILI